MQECLSRDKCSYFASLGYVNCNRQQGRTFILCVSVPEESSLLSQTSSRIIYPGNHTCLLTEVTSIQCLNCVVFCLCKLLLHKKASEGQASCLTRPCVPEIISALWSPQPKVRRYLFSWITSPVDSQGEHVRLPLTNSQTVFFSSPNPSCLQPFPAWF